MQVCSILSCESPHLARKLCSKHYYRVKRGQPVLAPTRFDRRPATVDGETALIPLANGKGIVVVDLSDKAIDRHNWSLSGDGYPMTYLEGDYVKLHHMLVGKPPEGQVVDHINRNKLDNRRCNLRFATYRLNGINKSKQSNNTSGYTGVTWVVSRNRWMAQINLNGKHESLGYFLTLEEAVAVRRIAESQSDEFRSVTNR